MSKQVDERVVSMQFDNANFERNVATTMSTLDKLKQKLNLPGASKGIEQVGVAASKVDFSAMENAAYTTGFSIQDIFLKTASVLEYQIANRIINVGKRMISALTIDPIKTGFQEYETLINSTQTILANTESKGSTIDDVNRALEELNAYADMTIYNFTEMTRNIGTFTAAGIDLDTSVNAIQGIANLAAVSGSTSQQASTAMYQLSQALAAGTIRLMDWNSVVNAGMGGEMFQNALRETSKLLGTGAEAAIRAKGSFRESLQTGWLTAEVLTETLKKFTISGANEMVAEYTGLSKEAVEAALAEAEARYGEAEAIEYASKALAEKSGKNVDEIKSTLELARNATDAATKVKTFSQLWDVMKESAQSGWAQTWKIIIGDLRQAKSLLTPLADFFTGIIGKFSDARNALLQSALGKSITSMIGGFSELLKPIQAANEAVTNITSSLGDLGEIVDRVILGDFGNGVARYDALTEAGINYYEVQNKVNETLGYSFRYTQDQIDAQNELLGTQKATNESQEEGAEATVQLTDKQKDLIKELASLTEEQARERNLSEEQIEALRELGVTAEKLGMPLDEFIDNMDQINGRWLLMNSLKNIGKSIVAVFTAMGEAWKNIFPPKELEERAEGIFNMLAALYKFSESIRLVDRETGELNETGEKFVRIFKGIFAALDIVLTIVGGPLKIAFKLLTEILGALNIPILDILAYVGDAIVKFRDWIDSIFDLSGIAEKIVPIIKDAAKAVQDWFASFEILDKIKEKISSAITSIREWFDELKNSENIPQEIAKMIGTGIGKAIQFVKDAIKNIRGFVTGGFESISGDLVSGFVNGLRDKASNIFGAIVEFATTILDTIRDVLGIQSPSTETYSDGVNFILGFWNGLKDMAAKVWNWIKEFGSKCVDVIRNIDLGTIFAGAISLGFLVSVIKIGGILSAFTKPLEGFGNLLDQAGDALKRLSKGVKKVLGAVAFRIIAEGIRSIALSLLMLVGAVIALTFVDTDKLWSSVGVIGALTGILAALVIVVEVLAIISKNVDADVSDLGKLAIVIMAIGVSVTLLASVAKKLGEMNPEQLERGLLGLAIIVTAMSVVLAAYNKIDPSSAEHISKIGGTFIKLAISMGLLIGVAKLMLAFVNSLGPGDIGKLIIGIVGIMGVIWALMAIANAAEGDKFDQVGSTLIKIAFAIGLLVGVAKIIAGMEEEEMKRAGIGLAGILVFIGLLTLFTKLAARDTTTLKKNGDFNKETMANIGSTLLAMAGAIAILVMAAKLIATMDWDEMGRAAAGIGFLALIVAGLTWVTKFAGKDNMMGVSATLLAMSIAIGILAGLAILLGYVNPDKLKQGLIAVGVLSALVAVLVASTKNAQNCVGNLVVITVAIALLVAAVAGLSMLDPAKLALSTVCVSLLVGMLAVLVNASKHATGSMGVMIIISAIIGLLGYIVYKLAGLPVESVIGSAVSLSVLMLAMARVLKILGSMKAEGAGQAFVGILLLTALAVPLLAFVGIIALMSKVDVAHGNIITLTVFTAALTGLLYLLAPVGKMARRAFKGIIALTALAIPLLAFVGVISLMSGVEAARDKLMVLAAFTGSMTLLLIPLAAVGLFATQALMGVLALTAMAVPLLVFVGIIALMQHIENAMENTTALVTLINSLTALMLVLGVVGPLASIGVSALTGLTVLMGVIGVFAVAIGALIEKFPVLRTFLDTGIQLMIDLASGIGQMVGAFIDGFLISATENLATLGSRLSQFIDNAMPFIEGVKMVDGKVLESVRILASAVIALTAADFINGVSSFLSGSDSFASLGTELSMFMINAMPFIAASKMLDASSLEGIKALAEAILVLTAADVLDGLTSWFTGGSSLSEFGAELAAFGPYIKTYSDAVAGIDTEAVKVSAEAGKTLAEMADTMPNSGGLLGKIFGENNIDDFGVQLEAFGESLKTYSDAVIGITIDGVRPSVDAAKLLVELAESIPNDGGLWGMFVGDNNIADFGRDLVVFGTYLKTYSIVVTGILLEPINASVEAGKALAGLAEAIPNSGGLWGWFKGDNSISEFGADLVTFGMSLRLYSMAVTGINLPAIMMSVIAGQQLAKLAEILPSDGGFWSWLKDDAISMADFSTEIVAFGNGIAEYSAAVADTNYSAMLLAVMAARQLVGLITSLNALDDTSGVTTFKTALSELGSISVDNFVNAFTNSGSRVSSAINTLFSTVSEAIGSSSDLIRAAISNMIASIINTVYNSRSQMSSAASSMMNAFVVTILTRSVMVTQTFMIMINTALMMLMVSQIRFYSMGTLIMTRFVMGIQTGRAKAMMAVTNILTQCETTIKDEYFTFYDAGIYLVDGFAAGIDANTWKAKARATAMAKAALEAAEEALGVESPSKEFYRIGNFSGLGFVNALGDYATKSYRAGSEMAESAKTGLSDAISKVNDLILGGADFAPTIRPVLDLSAVQNGAHQINGLFANQTLALAGVNANFDGTRINMTDAISQMRKANESSNSDMVRALGELRSDFGMLVNAINGMQICMDSGTVVGELIGKIDNSLGQMAAHRGRGN